MSEREWSEVSYTKEPGNYNLNQCTKRNRFSYTRLHCHTGRLVPEHSPCLPKGYVYNGEDGLRTLHLYTSSRLGLDFGP